MTRKQAVLRAIEILTQNQENHEICTVLEELSEELPLSHWTEKSILDAVNQFLIENDKLPNAKDFLKTDYLPNRITIKNKLGLTMEEFYNKYYNNFYYNNSSIYNHKDIEYWIDLFKEQYIKHGRPGLNDFDKLRDEGTPCVQTYCRIAQISTWNELLSHCGFEVVGQNKYSRKRPKRAKQNFFITCNFNEDINAEKLSEVNTTLEKIITRSN